MPSKARFVSSYTFKTLLLPKLAYRKCIKLYDIIKRATKRCRPSWLTNSALVYEPKCGGRGGLAGSHPVKKTVNMEPK
jgi:hypothetical protein